jgi:cell division protease FtsH
MSDKSTKKPAKNKNSVNIPGIGEVGMSKKPNIFVVILFVFLGWILISSLFFAESFGKQEVPLSQVVSEAQQGNIEKIEVGNDTITAYPVDGSDALEAEIPVNTDILAYLQEKGIDNLVESNRPFAFAESAGLIVNILFVALIAFFLFSMMRGRGGAGDIFNFGKSKAKLFNKDGQKNVSFSDVAVEEEIKEEMYEIVDFLKHPKKYTKVGARIPKGVLLVGPAGVGKTLIARAIAGEANVPFYSAAGSEFMEMLVGVGSARVRDMFKTATQSAPALIFIDEIDAIGRQRGMGIGGGHDEREQTLNQILVEMDGFENDTNVIVIAATNRPDMLDPALVRPGRFDRKISLQLPNIEARERVIKIHAKGKPFAKNVDFKQVARRTVGFSGADIENMLNEAAILAARENKATISNKNINEAATKVKLGPERKKLQDDTEKKATAYHEAGHAIVAHFLPHVDPVRRVSIVARSMSLGHTDITSDKEKYNLTKEQISDQLAMMLGGRAADEIFNKHLSTGASNDIERATDMAKRMVTEWGMSSLGPINYVQNEDKKWVAMQLGTHNEISEIKKQQIDTEVEKILTKAQGDAKKVLNKNKKAVEAVVAELLKKETLEQDEFEKIVGPASK